MAIRTDSGSLQRIKEENEYHMKSKIFSDKFFNSQLWKLAVPIMIQSLMLVSVAAVDVFMLGCVDQNFLPECKVLFFVIVCIFTGLYMCTGTSDGVVYE